MRIEFNRTGAERKALVKAISEITGAVAVYKYMPTCAYEIDYFTVTKDGALEFDDRADSEEIENLLEQLAERGFTAVEMPDAAADSSEEETVEKASEDAVAEPQGENIGLTVAIPLEKVAVGNLTKLLDAKGSLIKKALGIAELPIEINEDAVSFPWFDTYPDADTAKAYTDFIAALCRMAKTVKTASPKPQQNENPKYAMRTWLLRLGFIGDEFKTAREILTKRLTGDPLYFVLHDEPNPEMTSFVFRETLMTHLLLWGNAYAQIIRNGKGEVVALYPLMPNRMTVDRDEKGHLYYEYQTSTDEAKTTKGGTVRLKPSDVLHVPGLGFDGLVGYSPIAMAKNAIGLAIAAEEYGSKFYANGAAPSGVLEHPGTLKDPSKVRDSWTQTFGGSGNSHKIAVLEEGMKYTPISISPNEAQFLETRKFQINEIARIFRVPPHMVGDLEKSSFSNIEQQSLEFVKYTLEPWLVRWEQSLARVLISSGDKSRYFIKFNVDGLLRGDYQSRMNGYATARQNGWMSANDIRELENLDRIPAEDGGDLYLINGNMTKLADAGIFAASGKENNSDEEVLELEKQDGDESGDAGADTGEDAVSERHHRRGKLV